MAIRAPDGANKHLSTLNGDDDNDDGDGDNLISICSVSFQSLGQLVKMVPLVVAVNIALSINRPSPDSDNARGKCTYVF